MARRQKHCAQCDRAYDVGGWFCSRECESAHALKAFLIAVGITLSTLLVLMLLGRV